MKSLPDKQHMTADPADTSAPVSHLPDLITHGGVATPAAPATPEQTGIDPSVLFDLLLKLANSVPQLTTDWAMDRLCLPHAIVDRLFSQLREHQYLEILGQSGSLSH